MTREDMHKVLDAAVDANENNEKYEIAATFDLSFTGEMKVTITIWDRKRLAEKAEGSLICNDTFYADQADHAIDLIRKFGGDNQ